MALERPPKYLQLNPEGIKSYRPAEEQVATWHTVASKREGWFKLAEKYRVPADRIIALNFPGAVQGGKVVPEIVNWYLHHHRGFGCPETEDRKNRRFRGGEVVAIPFLGKVTVGEPVIRKQLEKSQLWVGVGESHSGDLVALGAFNWNAQVFRLGAQTAEEIEWAHLTSHGLKLGGGLGGSVGAVIVFAHGVESVQQLGAGFAWGDMDFDLAFAGQLGIYLKSLKGIGKIVTKMDDYEKLSQAGQELAKNRAFIKKGVYTIGIIGTGFHVWVGRKYGETRVTFSGVGL